MENAFRKIFSVSTADPQTDSVTLYLKKGQFRNLVLVTLETGVKGCRVKPGEIVVITRNSSVIKIFAQACLGCQAADCKIRI